DWREAATRSETLENIPATASGPLGLLWVFPNDPPTLTTLGARPLTLGRTSRCDVELPGREASRLHARIEQDGSLWVIRDAGSRNGVYLGGSRADAGVLRAGTVVRIGGAVALVVRAQSFQHGSGFRLIAEGLLGGAVLAERLRHLRNAAARDLSVVLEG